jgi:hypothetical protein
MWEQALTEVESRYDIADARIYLRGDGGGWIRTGMEWFPGAIFVLDKYHKNKAIKGMTAGLSMREQKVYGGMIRSALDMEDKRSVDEVAKRLCSALPERADKISASAAYLERFIAGISVCVQDPSANNGGCAEPHVSHVLSSRLSARPMAWSKRALVKFAPILAGASLCMPASLAGAPSPPPVRSAVARTRAAFRTGALGLPDPGSIVTLPLSGKVNGTQILLKLLA